MSRKVRTTIIGAIAAFGVAVAASPAAALAPIPPPPVAHKAPPHGGGGCDRPITPPQVCP
jgi:Spy/CpxP family protein refolding chaperone